MITNLADNTKQKGCVQETCLEKLQQRRKEYTEYNTSGFVCEVTEINKGSWCSDLGYTKTIWVESGTVQLVGEGPVENKGFE